MRNKILYGLIALLLPLALFVSLDEMVFIDDEGIRSLVAMEMRWSGDFLVPTLHNDLYLNKPPLWNWILVASFTLWGEASEWSARFPTVIALLGFAATAYFFSRPVLGKKLAFIHGLTVITCGRMLFWDSMLALIDVTFSWVVYTQIMLLWYYASRQQWWRAFGFAYLLCAIGFMLKGLPAIAFTGITVISLLVWLGRWRSLFSAAHLLSGLACLLLLAGYYLPLSQSVDLELIARRLFVESGKRTVVNYGWQETLSHLLAFPFEMFYHFLPWTLIIILFFKKGNLAALRTNQTVSFWALAFLVNLPLYWLSPNVYPRYLLMLFPLLFGVGLYSYRLQAAKGSRPLRIFHYLISGLMLLCGLAFFFAPLHPDTVIIHYRWPLAIGFGLLGLFILYLGSNGMSDDQDLRSSKDILLNSTSAGGGGGVSWRGIWQQSLLAFVAFLLLLRLAFNVFVLPPRALSDEKGQWVRNSATRLGEEYADNQDSLAVFGYTLMEPATSFYLERAYGGVVPRHFTRLEEGTAYIVDRYVYEEAVAAGDSLGQIYLRHKHSFYPVMQFKPPFPAIDPPEILLDGMGTGLPRSPR